jgi:hypothetical protein
MRFSASAMQNADHLTHPAAEVFTSTETIHAICRPRRPVQGMSRLFICRASDISSKR